MSTYVLVHGAYQGGWIWQPVADRLGGAGHHVYAPTLDGCGERSHALRPEISTESHGAELAQLLFYEDLSDVALVGTSSGGMVVCRAAELAPLHPVAALQQPVSLDSFWHRSWSAAVIHCRQSANPPEAHQRRTAERLAATWDEIDTGHYPMLSAPDELASLLLGQDAGV